MPALPPNSLIAITGITGYVASHVGLVALRSGHRVLGTARSRERAKNLKAAYEKQGIPTADLDSRLEFVIVDDLYSTDQWLKALRGVDGAVHVALSLEGYDDRQYLDTATKGTLAFLRAAKQVPSIQRVVITSSSSAVISPPVYRDKTLTGDDWNDEVVRIVEKNEPVDKDPVLKKASPFFLYGAAKTKAEKAAWEFMKVEKPQFDLVSTLPNANFGPVLHGEPRSTAAWISAILKNDPTPTQFVPAQWYVDVRDCGKMHVLSLTTPSMGNQQFWVAAGPYGWNAILGIIRKHFPRLQIPENFDGGELDRQKIDNKPATELLGGWISLEQSIVDLAKSLEY